jgi:hypothetical protein
METKPCIECGQENPLAEFYSHPANVCKARHKARVTASQRRRRWHAKHPLAAKAFGRLTRQPCVICGTLDFVWLCVKCHHHIHAAFPELHGHREQASVE